MTYYPDEKADPEEELDEHLKAELQWEAEMRAEESALRAESSDPASGMIQAVSMLDAKLQESLTREAALQQRLNEADQALDEARQAVRKNHEWHQLHDDFGGYDGSDIEQANLAVLSWTEAELSCCAQTPEERALLASGDYTPEELYGAGGEPSCPKCHKAAAKGKQLAKDSPEVGS